MSIADLATENWWVFASDQTIAQYQINYRGNSAVIRTCKADRWSGQTMAMIIYSTYDDHTFDIVLVFPGQPIPGIRLN